MHGDPTPRSDDPTRDTRGAAVPSTRSAARSIAGAVRTSSLSARLGIIAALLIIVFVTGAQHPQFLTVTSLANVAQQAAFFGIISLGMVFLLAMGEVDLSVGGNYMVCAVVGALAIQSGLDPWLAGVISIVLGAGLGFVNGLLATVLRVPVIIVTLGTLTLYMGLGLVASGSNSITDSPSDTSMFDVLGRSYLGFPAIAWVLVILTVVLALVFTRSRFGFGVRAIGSNKQAAILSGYPTARMLMQTTALVGGLAGVSSVMTVSFFAGADPNLGRSYELLVIAAAVIGGTSLTGGSGTVVGAMLGAFVIAVINAALLQFGVSADWTTLVTGAVIVAAVALDAIVRRVRRQP
ncbi:ABC transporter permease [uncultured Amnibacterium sp.]|uniref:ABC transporter permease n=1 Tax=uncultured Amnibacterium sp. TaxID=1631851 RepID=UPI0035CB951D